MPLERAGGQLPHRAVDRARRVLAKLAFREMGKCVFAEECLARRLLGYQTELVVHAEARHHVACNVGRLVQIVGRSGGCLIEGQHLGGPAAEKDGQSVFQVTARQQEAVLGRPLL